MGRQSEEIPIVRSVVIVAAKLSCRNQMSKGFLERKGLLGPFPDLMFPDL
jgi:hypothetical protein